MSLKYAENKRKTRIENRRLAICAEYADLSLKRVSQ